MRLTNRRPRGFTLVELLVVIAIIGLLISILLPTLSKARRAANSVKCQAQLRNILIAMQNYVQANKGYIPGSPNTSGYGLMTTTGLSQTNCPDISQIWDWQAPLAKYMGIRFNEKPDSASRVERFLLLVNHPVFTCPENDVVATAFTGSGGPSFPATRWISYNTAMVFLMVNNATPQPTMNAGAVGRTNGQSFYNPAPSYVPKITKIGKTAAKIYIADGARFNTGTGATMNLDWVGSTGGAYADPGAYSKFSRAWDRGRSPGNGGTAGDARVLAFRHGRATPFGNADTYKANFGFYDGHVESLGDLEASNPRLWLPKGCSVPSDTSELYPDVAARYTTGLPNPMIIPD